MSPATVANYDRFINAKSKRRTPPDLREITTTMGALSPDAIEFTTMLPDVTTFPFEEFSVDLRDGSNFKIEGNDLDAALQRMPPPGHTPLVKQLQALQDRTHGPQDWSRNSLLVTCGASEPMSGVFDMVLDEGDPIIVPVPLYTGTKDLLKPFCPQYIALEQDKDGVRPQELRNILEEMVRLNKTLPKLMYINPTACNPTGRNLSTERKRELYRIACEFNLLIVEDDPYYLLQFNKENSPSLLSMDVEGRVVRLDSFSKVLSAGLRVGYVTGPSQLVKVLERQMQVTTLHTSGLSQMLVSKLLDHWGFDKYFNHVEKVKKFYEERRDIVLAACDRHLKGLAEWDVPAGGMFLWMKVPVLEETWSLAVKHCLERCLLIVPGLPFSADLGPPQHNYIRLSFSLPTPTQMEEGIKLLAKIIQELVKDRQSS